MAVAPRRRQLSNLEGRRLILHAQGFRRRPAKPTLTDVRRVAQRVGAIRIDSINVIVRSHCLVPYSRLGPYPMEALQTLAYERGVLFEGSARGTSFMPVHLYPLLRYRMAAEQAAGAQGPRGERLHDAYLEHVYQDVAARGPLMARELLEPGESRGKWWGWSDGKIALEHLLSCGRLAVAGRENFNRLYDLAERVIPGEALDAPAPDEGESVKQLLVLAAQSLGVAAGLELVFYFDVRGVPTITADGRRKYRRFPWKQILAELVEEGRLIEVDVEDWPTLGYMVPGTRVPPAVHVRALLSPFDSMMWGMADVAFDFGQPLAQQLYVPADRRIFGYYVLPFVLGEAFVGRCDLKADRKAHKLQVQSAYVESGQSRTHVAHELAAELRDLRAWLGLDGIEVADQGDLAPALRKALRGRTKL